MPRHVGYMSREGAQRTYGGRVTAARPRLRRGITRSTHLFPDCPLSVLIRRDAPQHITPCMAAGPECQRTSSLLPPHRDTHLRLPPGRDTARRTSVTKHNRGACYEVLSPVYIFIAALMQHSEEHLGSLATARSSPYQPLYAASPHRHAFPHQVQTYIPGPYHPPPETVHDTQSCPATPPFT
ncbi:hypothetical protein P167DRAFT_190024 [Morchella conica CCBAS932]|uniref:Uncharacterized protein n=1 Tax=Morchella conica CCBAS932 TaxID=1392247 RepID=A0A3N4K764_9PEZI|nr:hypothetical protein P167DRAFT_190024 [Morchella conica CCBAS932]